MRAPLVPREVAASVDDLLAGARERRPLNPSDAKSGAVLESVVIAGAPYVVKRFHPDGDWTARGFGDLGCRAVRVWASGLLDRVPSSIDHAVVGAASGLGRNGWGAALLLRDVTPQLIPEGDDPVAPGSHQQLMEHMADLAAAFWDPDSGWLPDLLPLESRYSAFGPGWIAAEEARGFPDEVPAVAEQGWLRFAQRAPGDVLGVVDALRHDLDPLVRGLRRAPQTLLHGDWKMGNLGLDEGRTILLDWAYPGIGPIAHDLAWYLALNRARIPEPKEAVADRLRVALEGRGIGTEGWWERQVALGLLGALVQFGWEKALGDADELGWWCDRAREGARWLA